MNGAPRSTQGRAPEAPVRGAREISRAWENRHRRYMSIVPAEFAWQRAEGQWATLTSLPNAQFSFQSMKPCRLFVQPLAHFEKTNVYAAIYLSQAAGSSLQVIPLALAEKLPLSNRRIPLWRASPSNQKAIWEVL